MKTAFLILHYKALYATEECIDSILKYKNVDIYVLDNGSNDKTGEALLKKYSNNVNIKIYIEKVNVGFSRGNNFLFEKVKDDGNKYEFIIVCNNDIVFSQNEFMSILEKQINTDATVIGPDIILMDSDDIHQSPLMIEPISEKRLVHNISVYKRKQNHPMWFKIENALKDFLSKFLIRKGDTKIEYSVQQRGICLSGACMIFTSRYIEKYNALFEPETFLYYEEAILQYKLTKNGDYMLYMPELYVLHNHSLSTQSEHIDEKERKKFVEKNLLESSKILLNYIKEIDN